MNDIYEEATPKSAVIAMFKEFETFQDTLDPESELAIHLTHFGMPITLQLESVGFIPPDIVIFRGYQIDTHFDTYQYCKICQNVNQISLLLSSRPKLHEQLIRVSFQIH